MRSRAMLHGAAACVLAAAMGCAAGPEPVPAAAPPSALPKPDEKTGFTLIVSGSGDSVGAIPGSPTARYAYRFRQLEPPAGDRFTFQDRDLSFYFRPTPGALHFQVENRQDRQVWIEWDRCSFLDPTGTTGKAANSTTRWLDRFGFQAPTQIPGLQRYSDYLLPLDYLVDPAGREDQLHRAMFPEDDSAPQYTDRVFGVDLVFRVEERLRTYTFRFRVASVIPR